MALSASRRSYVTTAESLYDSPNESIHKAEGSLARVLLDLGETERAAPLVRAAVDGYRAVRGEDASRTRSEQIQEVRLLFRSPHASVDRARQATTDLISRMLTAGDPALNVARARRALGDGLLAAGLLKEAEAVLRENDLHLGEHSPHSDTDRAMTLVLLGDCLREQGDVEEAIGFYRRSLERFAASVGNRHPRALAARQALADLGVNDA
jgi:tetratricopeptide (TPR) repeat protein